MFENGRKRLVTDDKLNMTQQYVKFSYILYIKASYWFLSTRKQLDKKLINPSRINISQAFIRILFRGPQFQQDVGTLEKLQKKAVKIIKSSCTIVGEESIKESSSFNLVRKSPGRNRTTVFVEVKELSFRDPNHYFLSFRSWIR